MTWVDAKAWCESIGQELPTRDVLLMAYLNPETRSEFAYNYYWSSSEYNSYFAWSQYFYNGYQGYGLKNDAIRVRAVRAIKVEKLLAQPEQEPVEDRIARWHKLGYEQGRKSLKREPLSDEAVLNLVVQYSSRNELARAIEKAHGIGGDNE
jgi:hypothetical protein